MANGKKSAPIVTHTIQLSPTLLKEWAPTLTFWSDRKHGLLRGLQLAKRISSVPGGGTVESALCIFKDIVVELTEASYQGDDVGVKEWKVDIILHVTPSMGKVGKYRNPKLPLSPSNPTSPIKFRIYNDRGKMSGKLCPDTGLFFEATVEGRTSRGRALRGENQASFIFKSEDPCLGDHFDVGIEGPGGEDKGYLRFDFTAKATS